ncbi:nuclear transport factor 2 family protein [Micromonospora narathiwatensis]|uniref:SnoaL-like domain-containing protein n=1 Tax=Micromonospora narathiwatensis TaxID=299146 RepID=A0A1A8ZG73_9ACTN|nr:nuclear transport factor 2 family protein [Micromonospora narathiwatensis]SBT42867.1 SnoaL-like domain-containing protein [Micromonospora narathiwatensis]
MTSSASYAETIDRYVRFWNAEKPDEQQELASETFTDDIRYHAVIGVFTGRQALIGFHDQFTQHMPTAVFHRRGEPQIHHDRARLSWEIEVDGGQPFAAGTDVLVFEPDGRISSVTAFLDRAPEGFDAHAHN